MATRTINTTFDEDEFKSMISDSVFQAVKAQQLSFSGTEPALTILTRQQTAELLAISLPTLHDYTKRGIIKAYRLGTKIRYKREDIDQALKQIKNGIK